MAGIVGMVALMADRAGATTPTRYDVAASVANVPLTGGATFGSKFFFTTGNQLAYRVVPAGQTEADPALRWEYWSTAAGARAIEPAAGYAALEVRGLNARGEVIGQTLRTAPDARNAAFLWTLIGGPRVPTGFDAGFSALDAIAATGRAAGFSYSVPAAGPVRVAWDAANAAVAPTEVPPPAGTSSPQVVGVADNGDVLLHVNEAGTPRLALWDGATSALIGPVPAAGEAFYPANAAINGAGDVVMLVFTVGQGARLLYLAAADRETPQEFTFGGNVESVYNLRLSDAGVATFDAGIGGTSFVQVVSAARGETRTFPGYRSFLNSGGAMIYGLEGRLRFWDAAAWVGQPAEVPLSFATSSGGFDVVGFNDEGRVLALNVSGGRRELLVLAPAGVTPPKVTVRPIRREVRLRAGQRVRDRLVETRVSGDAPARIRYVVAGRLPQGCRFRASEAILIGLPTRAETRRLRVAATYVVRGEKRQSPWVTITVRVR